MEAISCWQRFGTPRSWKAFFMKRQESDPRLPAREHLTFPPDCVARSNINPFSLEARKVFSSITSDCSGDFSLDWAFNSSETVRKLRVSWVCERERLGIADIGRWRNWTRVPAVGAFGESMEMLPRDGSPAVILYTRSIYKEVEYHVSCSTRANAPFRPKTTHLEKTVPPL